MRPPFGSSEGSVVMDLPKVVSSEEWKAANERIVSKEKELTRQIDALAAGRRRQDGEMFGLSSPARGGQRSGGSAGAAM